MHPSDSPHQWEGWWEQQWYGRQPMENLRITFDQGRIEGSGHDIVGPFTLLGVIAEGGAVVIHKQYLGQHSVEYRGTYDGEGVLAGEWRIAHMRGAWLIRLRRASQQAGEHKEVSEIVPSR